MLNHVHFPNNINMNIHGSKYTDLKCDGNKIENMIQTKYLGMKLHQH